MWGAGAIADGWTVGDWVVDGEESQDIYSFEKVVDVEEEEVDVADWEHGKLPDWCYQLTNSPCLELSGGEVVWKGVL